MSHPFLQHYWWLVIALLASLLVALLFVQGGQGLLYVLGRTRDERDRIAASLGRKWEVTFTTLVTFGGALFASFPLFYATSFGGAFYLWTLLLLLFVVQAVSYEYRRKPHNILGERTFDLFLQLNGIGGTLLLGVAVATLFTGGHFTIHRFRIADPGQDTAIAQWTTAWRGLEALAVPLNVLLGLAVLFLSRVLGCQYLLYDLDDEVIRRRARRRIRLEAPLFLLFFAGFVAGLFLHTGLRVDPATGRFLAERSIHWHNLLAMPVVALMLAAGVAAVVAGIVRAWRRSSGRAFWWSAAGTVLAVLALLLTTGWRATSYYPSLADPASSLTLQNSSSSRLTLAVMAVVSLFVPVVAVYIAWAWRKMGRASGDTRGTSTGA